MKIAFFYPPSLMHDPIDPTQIWDSDRGLTGSEVSCFMYALNLARFGHQVAIFTKVPAPGDIEKVTVCPYNEWFDLYCKKDNWDAACAWMDPAPLKVANSKMLRLFNQQFTDFGLCEPGWEEYTDILTCVSQHHAEHTTKLTTLPKDKYRILYNFVDTKEFRPREKIEGKMIWASSHDRGLHWLLEAFPKIKQRVPLANLHIFYNFNGIKRFASQANNHPSNLYEELGRRSRYTLEAIRRLNGRDIYVHGAVSRRRLLKEMASAEVLPYPLDPVRYTEAFGVTVLEACACGTVPVLCTADAFDELWGPASDHVPPPYPEHKDEFIDLVVKNLTDKHHRETLKERCVKHAKRFDWTILSRSFEKFLETRSEGLPLIGDSALPELPETSLMGVSSFRGNKFEYFYTTNSATLATHQDEQVVRNELFKVASGDVVLDIGCGFGSYILPALAVGASHVYGWTPLQNEISIIQESLKLNNWTDKVTLFSTGLYDKDGYLSIDGDKNAAGLGFSKTQEPESGRALQFIDKLFPVNKLDDFLDNGKIQIRSGQKCWMKIDVEGSELYVLRGAVQFISKYNPNILVENHECIVKGIEDDVKNLLSLLNYRCVKTIPHNCGVSHSLYVKDQ